MYKGILTGLLFVALIGVYAQNQPTASSRIALVIGVQNYSSVPPLRHSLKDAKDMSTALKLKGFKVETLIDPKTKKQIKDAITRYYNAMTESSGAVGIIYYAGHGTQFEGENYLIPASATLQVPGDLDDQCVKMNVLMSVLNSSNSNLNIFLLDACRTNNFVSFTRDLAKGLASVEAPKGSIVVFATQPGTVASDGTGSNGLFTSKLLKYINEPDLDISDVLRKVKRDVNTESEGKQLPSVVDNSIGGEFYFNKTTQVVAPTTTSKPTPSVAAKTNGAIKNTTNPVKQETPTEKNSPLDYGYGVEDAAIVTVGKQTWIAKNLNVTTFTNGEPIPEAKTNSAWSRAASEKKPAWCYYKNDPANEKIYGKLYNWYALNDPRGLAPQGWHLATDEEWGTMTDFYGGENEAGDALKSLAGWNNEKGNGSNSSKMTCLPGGMRYTGGEFKDIGKGGYWWCGIEQESNKSRELVGYNNIVHKSNNYKGSGLSVRCIKD
ncbi:MAG: caspase family protein [Bacteroidetes bacterium]|nr:caspase family protein [Bacteroidota bacterium]